MNIQSPVTARFQTDKWDRSRSSKAVAAVAAVHAEAVDRSARFPSEAMAAARAERLLGAMIPTNLGGQGATVSDIVEVCYVLGRACASTGMTYAMHQIRSRVWFDTAVTPPGRAICSGGLAPSSCCWGRQPPTARVAATCATAPAP